jgi:hypothetical protein
MGDRGAYELAEALSPDLEIIDRSTVNAWDEPRVKAAIQATGRKKLIVIGISPRGVPCFSSWNESGYGSLGRGIVGLDAVDEIHRKPNPVKVFRTRVEKSGSSIDRRASTRA